MSSNVRTKMKRMKEKLKKSEATAAGMEQKAMESLEESLKRNRSDSEDR